MQVATHAWSSSASKYRLNGSDTGIPSATDGVDDRSGGRRQNPARGGRQPVPEKEPERTGHKKVFVARSLSSTLTALDIASAAVPSSDASLDSTAAAELATGPAVSLASASLDDLLSGFLSAA